MSLVAIARKELGDLVREKRFGAWALTFLAFWMLFLFFWLVNIEQARQFGGAQSVTMLAEPAFYFYGIGFAVLGLFVLTDGVTKEREAGMLHVVAAKPIVRWHIVFAKLLAGVVVYVASYLVSLPAILVLAASVGMPALEMLSLLYLGPFLVLYAFLLGLGLFLGVVSSSSKVAIGTASGLYIPLFFLMSDGPLRNIYLRYPAIHTIADYTPFQVAHDATQVVVNGGQMPWLPIFVVLAMAAALCVAAFWTFSRQEAAA